MEIESEDREFRSKPKDTNVRYLTKVSPCGRNAYSAYTCVGSHIFFHSRVAAQAREQKHDKQRRATGGAATLV